MKYKELDFKKIMISDYEYSTDYSDNENNYENFIIYLKELENCYLTCSNVDVLNTKLVGFNNFLLQNYIETIFLEENSFLIFDFLINLLKTSENQYSLFYCLSIFKKICSISKEYCIYLIKNSILEIIHTKSIYLNTKLVSSILFDLLDEFIHNGLINYILEIFEINEFSNYIIKLSEIMPSHINFFLNFFENINNNQIELFFYLLKYIQNNNISSKLLVSIFHLLTYLIKKYQYNKELILNSKILNNFNKYFETDNYKLLIEISQFIGYLTFHSIFYNFLNIDLIIFLLKNFPIKLFLNSFIWMLSCLIESNLNKNIFYNDNFNEFKIFFLNSTFDIKNYLIRFFSRLMDSSSLTHLNLFLNTNLLEIICDFLFSNIIENDTTSIIIESLKDFSLKTNLISKIPFEKEILLEFLNFNDEIIHSSVNILLNLISKESQL